MEFDNIANAFRNLEAALFEKFNEQEVKIDYLYEELEKQKNKEKKFKERILNVICEELSSNE